MVQCSQVGVDVDRHASSRELKNIEGTWETERDRKRQKETDRDRKRQKERKRRTKK